MKFSIFTLLMAVAATFSLSAQTTFHDYTVVTIGGDTISLSQFYGKKVLVVNTATLCAYTHQYDDLQQLYTDYSQFNFTIVGFPCNNFGNQEPGADSTIEEFCHSNYDVTFPMMSKVDIVSWDTADVYKWLQRGALNGVQTAHVSWNFNKFLIDEAGGWVAHFDSPVDPQDTAITNWIMTPSVIQTGVNDVQNNTMQVYPNPNNGVVTFQSLNNASNIQIMNMLGQSVYSVAVNADKLQLDLSNQPKGVYAYRLVGKQGTIQNGKLIIE